MKQRLYLIIMLCAVTLSSMAQTIGEAFYVYRNDGQFNAFFRDEVISIDYSYEDADGNTYNEIVTQIINTPDSVYKIPLAAIDSVGFVTPETQYKPGVINMQDGLSAYVSSVVEDVITLKPETPSDILPHVGDKLVTTEMNDFFPIGYAGQVIKMNTTSAGIVVECEKVALEEVFDCFYGFTKAEVPAVNIGRRAFWDGWAWPEVTIPDGVYSNSVTYQPEPFRHSLTQGLPNGWEASIGDWAGSYSSQYDFVFAPKLWINGFVKIARDERYFSITITGDYSLREEFGYTGKLSWSPSAGLNVSAPIPVCQFLQVFIEPGLFVKAALETSSNLTFTQHYTSAFHYEWSSNGTIAMNPVYEIIPKEHTISGQSVSDGELAFGAYFDLGVQAFSKDLASIYGHAEIGLAVGGNVNTGFDSSSSERSTDFYEMLNESGFEGSWYWGTSFEAQMTPFLKYSHNLPFGKKTSLWKKGYVPTFSDVTLKANAIGSLHAETKVSGNLQTPVDIGFALFNEDGEKIDSYFSGDTYQNQPTNINHTFTDIEEGRKYTVYPIVRFNGVEMLASPSAEAEASKMPVKITNFQQTGSQYEKDAFSNNGRKYSYKYDCAVTVELTNSENVEDWGYVYEDPYGQPALISLSSYGSSYTDKRYSYYRNEVSSTVRLYEYVKYTGDNEYYYGQPKDYEVKYEGEISCPDNNHPHRIDMGLPSGTKWACCNAGASKPEEYGNYWKFEEITQAPSNEQISELLHNCSYTFTTHNGVYGVKFTGPNRRTIFLPAAGWYYKGWDFEVTPGVAPKNRAKVWVEEYSAVGTEGKYWSSTTVGGAVGQLRLDYRKRAYLELWDYNIENYYHTLRPVFN